jgi:long-chain acyl-CoA synthetase
MASKSRHTAQQRRWRRTIGSAFTALVMNSSRVGMSHDTELRFERLAALDPDAEAVIDVDGRTWSRGALASLANRTCHALLAAGIAPGDTVAIAAPNCGEFLAGYRAAITAGCYVVPVNWHLAEPELAHLLRDARPRAMLVHPRLGAAVLRAIRALLPHGGLALAAGNADGFVPLLSFCAGQPASPVEGIPLGRVLPYTSATTGRPKGVYRSLAGARAALERNIAWHRSYVPGDAHVHLCASMLYHAAPLEGATFALEMGHKVVLTDRWDGAALLDAIEHHSVTTTFMVPTMFVRLLKLPPALRTTRSCASLRFVMHGGAPCPIEVKRAMLDWWGPIVWEAYGSTEAQGTIVSPEEWLQKPGTVGRPIPGSAIRILDDHGNDLPPRTVGTVYIAPHTGEHVAYRDGTEPPRNGDFVTVGDLGYLDEDGYLFLCDRRPDLIVSSGMNVYPVEIESQLVLHPAVQDCAVIGRPHELCGEVPVALVEPAPGVAPGPKLTAELQDFLAARLAPMKLPKRIDYVRQLPRDPAGKLLRRHLRADLLQ